jgi:ubiquinone/menaquinone biosynthesis C-methylase UbiE
MSVIFDRAVSFYDRTRGLPEQAEAWLAGIVAEQAPLPAGSRVLEIGVGTGRIALPLVGARRYQYTGIDLSREMMGALRAKAPRVPITLVQGDVARLPFAADTFDAVVAVHVFHLISAWRQAMDEVARVLHPSGLLLHGRNQTAEASPLESLRTWLYDAAKDRGERRADHFLDHEQIRSELAERFGPARELATPYWQVSRTPAEILDSFATRCWSSTWHLSDATIEAVVVEGRRWALEDFGSLDTPVVEEHRFVWNVYGPAVTQ